MKLVHPIARDASAAQTESSDVQGLASIYLFRLRKFQPATVKQVHYSRITGPRRAQRELMMIGRP